MSSGLERNDRRAHVPGAVSIGLELELPPHLKHELVRDTIEGVDPTTGAWIVDSNPSGRAVTVFGTTDAVSRTIESLHPPKDPSIPPLRGLGSPTSRRALP